MQTEKKNDEIQRETRKAAREEIERAHKKEKQKNYSRNCNECDATVKNVHSMYSQFNDSKN